MNKTKLKILIGSVMFAVFMLLSMSCMYDVLSTVGDALTGN